MSAGEVWQLVDGGLFYMPDLDLASSFVPAVLRAATCKTQHGAVERRIPVGAWTEAAARAQVQPVLTRST